MWLIALGKALSICICSWDNCEIIKKNMYLHFYNWDTLKNFLIWIYGVGHMVQDHLDGLLFLISSKGSFICTNPQTG